MGVPRIIFGFVFLAIAGIVGLFLKHAPHKDPATVILPPVESVEQVTAKCAAPTENRDCPASGPIISAPYFINGVIQGYLVYPGEDPDVFDSTGLKFGDLVTAVEGQPLTDVELMNRLLRNLSRGQPVTVTVERAGTTKVIDLLTD